MNTFMERMKNGIITENPVFIMALGLCPTFAVTTSATNAIGMGLSSMAVLVFSNLLISGIRGIIPDRVRLPAEIVVVASLVTIVQLLMQGFFPEIYKALGIYIPLIVVNCIILGRAEAYAMKNGPIASLFDGIGMGLGFTFALLLLGGFREIIGAGSIFGIPLIPDEFHISLFVLPPGAFLVMAFLTAAMQYYQDPDKHKEASYPSLEDVKTPVRKPAPKPAAAPAAAAAKAAAPAAAAAAKAAAPAQAAAPAAAAAAEKAEEVKAEAVKAAETVKKEAES